MDVGVFVCIKCKFDLCPRPSGKIEFTLWNSKLLGISMNKI